MSAPISQGVISSHPISPVKTRYIFTSGSQGEARTAEFFSAWLTSKLAHGSHSELVIDTTRVPGELFPVPPLVERLRSSEMPRLMIASVLRKNILKKTCAKFVRWRLPPPSHGPQFGGRLHAR